MFNLLFADGDIVADWVIQFCSITRLVCIILITLSALALIVTTLMQSNANDNNSEAISGGSHESYYAQNKGDTRDGKLKKATIVFSCIIAFCAIMYFVTLLINNPA